MPSLLYSTQYEVVAFCPICKVGAFLPDVSLLHFFTVFFPVYGRYLASSVSLGQFPWCSSRYNISVFFLVLGGHNVLLGLPSIRSLPIWFIILLCLADYIWYSIPTLSTPFISWFSPYFPVLAFGGLSHYSLLCFPNQNPRLGSICGETADLEGRVPYINTQPYIFQH